MTLVLASGSPRRAALLEAAGYDFEIDPADVDEAPRAGEGPADLVVRLARAKAVTVANRHPNAVALAADTVVAVGDRILGKPLDHQDAVRMLTDLAAGDHDVMTGWAIVAGGDVQTGVTKTVVTFGDIDRDEIDRYVRTGEPLDKAGAYGIQGEAGAYVTRLEGQFDNVVGLPLDDIKPVLGRYGCHPTRRD